MYVETDGQSGFFEKIEKNGVIRNLFIKNANIIVPSTNDSFYHGFLAGWVQNGAIEDCGVSGVLTADISGTDVPCIGGVVGSAKQNSVILRTWSTAQIVVLNDDLPSMVGGIVGQWEHAANGASIIDSYFGGSITVNESTTSTAGILGAGLSFNGHVVLINGCVSYGDLIQPEGSEENAVHIGALDEYGQIINCIWPDDGKFGVVRLVVDWDSGTASADPNFDQTQCGHSVSSFNDQTIIDELNSKATQPNLWALSMDGYPVFASQNYLIRADYTAIDNALAKVPTDLSQYTDASVNKLNDIISSIDTNITMDRQNEIDLIATSILEAISQLQLKPVENASSTTGCIATDKNCDGVVTCDEVNGPGWVWSELEKACVLNTVEEPMQSSGIYHFVNTSDH